jgi:Mrp family chromosome partitioning ATPase
MKNPLETLISEDMVQARDDLEPHKTSTALPARHPTDHPGELERVIGERLNRTLEWSRKLPFFLDRSVIELYWRVDSQRTDRSSYVLQFVAASAGSGTSTLATGYATVASLVMHKPVLLLSVLACQGGTPPILEVLGARRGLQEAVEAIPDVPGLYRASLTDDAVMLTRAADDLQKVLDLLRERFSAVLVDGPAIEDSEASLILSRYCDATALIVRAEHSRRAAVREAVSRIENHGGEVIGTVLNRQKKHLPAWLDRRLN